MMITTNMCLDVISRKLEIRKNFGVEAIVLTPFVKGGCHAKHDWGIFKILE